MSSFIQLKYLMSFGQYNLKCLTLSPTLNSALLLTPKNLLLQTRYIIWHPGFKVVWELWEWRSHCSRNFLLAFPLLTMQWNPDNTCVPAKLSSEFPLLTQTTLITVWDTEYGWLERTLCNAEYVVELPLRWLLCQDLEQVIHSQLLSITDSWSLDSAA